MSPEAYLVALLGTGPLPEPPAAPDDRARLAELVELHALEGLAVARDREGGGGCLPQALRARWEPAYRARGLATALTLEAAARGRAALARAGHDALLFKGAALVEARLYPDPGARRMDDADLLVRASEAVAAVETLLEAGFRPVGGWVPERMGWVDSVTLRAMDTPAGTEAVLDLHWSTAYDRIRFGGAEGSDPLWQGADLEAGLPAPGPHLVAVAEHLLKHLRFKVHLAAWADVARLAGAVGAETGAGEAGGGWEEVEARLRASRLEVGLRALLSVAARRLGAPVPGTLTAGARVDLVERLDPAALAGTLRPAGSRLAGLALRARLLGSVRAVGADLREALLPPAAWLRARYGTEGAVGWVRYWADLARWAAYRGRSPASPNQELFDPRSRE